MTEIELIKNRALAFFNKAKPHVSVLLWEKTQRILRNAEMIAEEPQIANSDMPIDRFCLRCGCLFLLSCEVGGENSDENTQNGSKSSDSLARSAEIAEAELGSLLPAKKLNYLCKVIVESVNHRTNLPESMILSDAAMLESVGAVGLMNEIGRNINSGKGVGELITSRKKKELYCYWDAMLKDGFHFEMVREIAEERHEFANQIMRGLEEEHAAVKFLETV